MCLNMNEARLSNLTLLCVEQDINRFAAMKEDNILKRDHDMCKDNLFTSACSVENVRILKRIKLQAEQRQQMVNETCIISSASPLMNSSSKGGGPEPARRMLHAVLKPVSCQPVFLFLFLRKSLSDKVASL